MIAQLKYALHRARHRQRFELLEELLRHQALTRVELRERQEAAMAAIADHAFQQSPFYAQKYAFASRDGIGRFEWDALPILHKDEVIRHRDQIVARDADPSRLKIGHTGGSTGKPVSFYYAPFKHELMRAGMIRSYMWSGWRPGQKILNFWGARQDIKGGWGKAVSDFIAAETTIPAWQHGEAQLRQWAGFIRTYRPVLLQGYASILAELARYVVEAEVAMPRTLVGVYSTAEVLYDWQRELMEQAFGCKVYNQYGSREIPNIACECRHGNQHVFTDMVRLESLKLEQEERLVVTSLTDRVMPFIRYDIGDAGRLKEGDCPCGSPFPLMEMGLCRSNDLIRTPSGKRIYPSYFIHLLDGLAGIRQYQFVQSEAGRITLNLVSTAGLGGDTIQELQARVRREIDERLMLEISPVAEISRTVSGKHRFVISNLA